MRDAVARLLTINTGSSSVKAAVYDPTQLERCASGIVDGIGQSASRMRLTDLLGHEVSNGDLSVETHEQALETLLHSLVLAEPCANVVAVGHRVVHGGDRYRRPQPVTKELVDDLRELTSIDPDHLPQAISAIEATSTMFPAAVQVACFDTGFHQTMPEVARSYALPPRRAGLPIERYGFHGLSCESIMGQLHEVDPTLANARIVIAHLGNGASMTAVNNGVGIDTTMGFSPTGGLVMGTRSGDLDPSVVLELLHSGGLSADGVADLLNHESGLLGVSQRSADMRDLLANQDDARARLAVDLFCYSAKKQLGSLVAVLTGLDILVFTGGIGENSPKIRWRICANLEQFGVILDSKSNERSAAIISDPSARVSVRVIQTDEQRVIAGHTMQIAGIAS